MGPSELPPTQSLVKAQEPSGWMMWPVLVQRHHWADASSVDGASTTVGMVKMQEWCAKVGRFIAIAHIIFVCLVSVREGRWA